MFIRKLSNLVFSVSLLSISFAGNSGDFYPNGSNELSSERLEEYVGECKKEQIPYAKSLLCKVGVSAFGVLASIKLHQIFPSIVENTLRILGAASAFCYLFPYFADKLTEVMENRKKRIDSELRQRALEVLAGRDPITGEVFGDGIEYVKKTDHGTEISRYKLSIPNVLTVEHKSAHR